ncbi:MAG: hypothetical protein AAFZ01_06120 [Pseudomonadota bacterium]
MSQLVSDVTGAGVSKSAGATPQPPSPLDLSLSGAATGRAIDAISSRYHLQSATVRAALQTVRPLILNQVAQLCENESAATQLLHWLADPALTRIRIVPEDIIAQDIRVTSDAMSRGLSRGDASLWSALDVSAAQVGMSHQTLRAMLPLLTLLLMAAIRDAAAPAFLRHLHALRPDDQTTDPYAFAAQQADTGQAATSQAASSQALRWLDAVLSRAQDTAEIDGSMALRHER